MNIRDIVQTITGKKKALGVELWKELFKTAVQVNKENIKTIKELVDAGADVNLRDSQKRSLLYYIINNEECHTIAGIFINAGADVNARDDFGKTPLHDAAESDDPEYMKMLIEAGADLEAADENGWTPLMTAAGKIHAECVRLLLDAGADVHKMDWKDGQSSLLYSLKDRKILNMLIEAGLDINSKDSSGNTVLMQTLELRPYTTSGVESALMLIEAGVDVNAANNHGVTALMKLVCSGLMNKEVIPVIIAAGADVNAKNNEGMTALHYAAVSNPNNELDCYGSIASEYMLALIRAGADMDIKDDLGRTAEDRYRRTFPTAYNKNIEYFRRLAYAKKNLTIEDSQTISCNIPDYDI
ncbi:MAG: ankyrin repeat domain-containing protein [Synergistaceae bacterium]|nr:ankyrin repeat domain-containing protein [Synergistaceae bacterium]